ncbi:MAG: sensor histidine kinase [Bacteriovoracia bacterium]
MLFLCSAAFASKNQESSKPNLNPEIKCSHYLLSGSGDSLDNLKRNKAHILSLWYDEAVERFYKPNRMTPICSLFVEPLLEKLIKRLEEQSPQFLLDSAELGLSVDQLTFDDVNDHTMLDISLELNLFREIIESKVACTPKSEGFLGTLRTTVEDFAIELANEYIRKRKTLHLRAKNLQNFFSSFSTGFALAKSSEDQLRHLIQLVQLMVDAEIVYLQVECSNSPMTVLSTADEELGHSFEQSISKKEIACHLEDSSVDMNIFLLPETKESTHDVLGHLGQKLQRILCIGIFGSDKKKLGTLYIGDRHGRLFINEIMHEQLSFICPRLAYVLETLAALATASEQRASLAKEVRTLSGNLDSMMRDQELRKQLVASISHDLKTPLTASILSLEVFTKKMPSEPNVQRPLARAHSNLLRISRMLTNVLDVFRLEEGRQLTLNPTKMDLQTIISEVIEDLATTTGRVVRANIPPSPGYWDKDALIRVFENLLNNAIRYGSNDRPVVVETSRKENEYIVSVNNTGSPISPEDLPHIFEFGYRSRASRQKSLAGWGIGLTATKLIVEAHGGKISVTSNETEGTTFTFTLPVDERSSL